MRLRRKAADSSIPTSSMADIGYLGPKLARNPDKPVVLYTDPDVEYQDLIRVYDMFEVACS